MAYPLAGSAAALTTAQSGVGVESEFVANVSEAVSVNVSAALLLPPPFEEFLDRAFVERLYFTMLGVVASVVCFLGVIGNVLNAGVLTLLSRKWRSPTYTILLALSLADLTILIIYLTFSLTFFTRRPPVIRPADIPPDASDFTIFLYYTWHFAINAAVCASNWLVVAVTFFRFLAVYFPMKVGVHCTPRKVRAVIAAVFAFAVAAIIPDMMTLEVYRDEESGSLRARDTPLYEDPTYVRIYYTLQHVLLHVVPYSLNGLLVALLIATLCRSGRWLRAAAGTTRQACVARKSDQRHVSVMLVALVLWSMALTTPTLVYRVYRDHMGGDRVSNEGRLTLMTFRAACDLAELVNYASNFYLFCLCNPSYRSKLADALTTSALLKGVLAGGRGGTGGATSGRAGRGGSVRSWSAFSRHQLSLANHHTIGKCPIAALRRGVLLAVVPVVAGGSLAVASSCSPQLSRLRPTPTPPQTPAARRSGQTLPPPPGGSRT